LSKPMTISWQDPKTQMKIMTAILLLQSQQKYKLTHSVNLFVEKCQTLPSQLRFVLIFKITALTDTKDAHKTQLQTLQFVFFKAKKAIAQSTIFHSQVNLISIKKSSKMKEAIGKRLCLMQITRN
jgi:hypothetical protein